ncbi:long-chain fatty acid transport protein 4 [Folsomia candida]|nr:long-chain fatty acid transport protein 4 [Folsomia candida]
MDFNQIWVWFQNFAVVPSNWGYLLLGVIGVWILYKFIRNPRRFLCILRTIPRDFGVLPTLLCLKRDLRKFQNGNYTIFKAFDHVVKRDPKKTLIYFEDFKMTTEEVQQLSYRVANYFKSLGFKKGDTVGIFMDNCAEYAALWLGLSRIGVVSALINYNLRLKPLKHCIEAVNCKAVIFSADLSDALKELMETLGALAGDPTLYYFVDGSQVSRATSEIQSPKCSLSFVPDLNQLLQNVHAAPPLVSESLGFNDRAMFIFTSGTTGLPKAASIKHSRLFLMGTSCYYVSSLGREDVMYTSLPLYHGSGTMFGTGITLIYGTSQVIRKKFSASSFWSDCIKYKVTAAQYIGETCRYILAQPPSSLDKAHTVRVMFGNGLRSEIWGSFVTRFGVKIRECYGSTEGNCGMANMDDKLGAVGFVPIWAPNVLPLRLIKVDEETGEPIRDPKTGFVYKCGQDEPGELVGRIIKKNPMTDFEGYADKSSTGGKILENAFRKGDSWFRSGDVLVQDELGYFFFRDRKGDTFRWKGENCSTAEVESIISTISGLKGTTVFGVEVPGTDGRAGMAVMSDPENSLDLHQLAIGVIKSLPSYARPLFLRILTTEIEMTGTYKLKKNEYQKSGFNLNLIQDKVYFFNGKQYLQMDKQMHEDIISGKIRV